MVQRAVAVVLDGPRVLVIRRRRNGDSYSVLPGGGVEQGESPAEAAIRELAEETSLVGTAATELWSLQHADRRATYFRVSVPDPVRSLVLGGPELDRRSAHNSYRPEWIHHRELSKVGLRPDDIRPLLMGLFSGADDTGR